MSEMSLSEQLLHTTIRIETDTGTGTGFFFDFSKDKEERALPVLVTNKHVVKGASTGQLVFSWLVENGMPIQKKHSVVIDSFQNYWLQHPEANVDLCVLPLAPIVKSVEERDGISLFYKSLSRDLIPSETTIEDLSDMEEVTMIGYPNGLWDSHNGLPIVRRGLTATSYRYDYQGKPEFVIDAACFPGSSGSPILVLNQSSYATQKGINIGSRLLFLGVLHSGPVMNARGEIKLATPITPYVETGIMINLGIAVKARKLLDFDAVLGI